VLLLPGTDAAAAQRLVERIRREVENHVFPADSRVTCSFGIADTSSGSTLHSLFSSADQSLYQAKKRGKNAACLSVTPQET
jgi:diguanylate cyclase (GGDEF)-like protein